MLAPDTLVSLLAAVDLINTRPNVAGANPDRLTTQADVLAFVSRTGYAPDWFGGRMAVDPLRASREAIHALWTTPTQVDAASKLNTILRAYDAFPRLVHHEPFGWHLHLLPEDASLEEWVLVDAADAVSATIRSGEFARLGRCAAPDCDGVFVDSTKNLTQRYCTAGSCAERVRSAEFRARRRRDAAS